MKCLLSAKYREDTTLSLEQVSSDDGKKQWVDMGVHVRQGGP